MFDVARAVASDVVHKTHCLSCTVAMNAFVMRTTVGLVCGPVH